MKLHGLDCGYIVEPGLMLNSTETLTTQYFSSTLLSSLTEVHKQFGTFNWKINFTNSPSTDVFISHKPILLNLRLTVQ